MMPRMTPIAANFSTLAQNGWLTDGLLIGGLLLITFYFISRVRKRRQNSAPRLTPQEQLERNQQQRGLRGDLEELMVTIEQFTQRCGSQLDAKAIRLEKLMRQAEATIDRLERAQSNAPARPVSGDQSDPSSVTPGSPGARSDISVTPGPLGTSSPSPRTARSPLATPMPDASASLPQDTLSRSVYLLAAQGVTPPEIAKRLNEHIGKVELILALRQTQ